MAARRRPGRALAALGATALVLLAACGGGESEAVAPVVAEDPGPIHVHALGVDPADGALMIATHTGLFRLGPGETKAVRVGELYQDTMGFTVVGPGRFLGSGHPDVRQMREKDLPPQLGLIESTDGGLTWRPVSLLGEADFHVLRVAGDLVVGYDSTRGRLLASRDGGDTWERRVLPGRLGEPLVDLVLDPARAERFLASTPSGLYRSSDAGASWSPLGGEAGLLAWPAPGRVYLLAFDGTVRASGDGGASWSPVGTVGGEPAAFLARTQRMLVAALHDGTIVESSDGGASWRVLAEP